MHHLLNPSPFRKMALNHSFLPRLFMTICMLSAYSIITNSQCLEDQKSILLQFKSDLVFSPSQATAKLLNWNQTVDCCSWGGVVCDGEGRVTQINLSYCKLSGSISPSLANLTELAELRLHYNNLIGQVPPFYSCKNLSHINLSSNRLTGLISSEHFEGLSNLVYLNLEYNSLSGRIPQSLFLLPSLQKLVLSNNQFSGGVDEFPNPHSYNLEKLDLSSNRLEGPVPDSFFNLQKLIFLSLSYNNFNGTVRLQGLQNLTRLELSYNNLSIDATSTNSSWDSFPKLEYLGLASCNLYNFPDFVKRGDYLYSLDLSSNRITEVPSWFWEIGIGFISDLNMSNNLLVDMQKPSGVTYYDALTVLDLHSNQLRGELPLPPKSALYVDYSNNFLERIPRNIGNFSTKYLQFLSLANNSITGTIPTSLCNAIGLKILDLSDNSLTDFPPCLLDNMQSLGVLSLGGNNISGEIPDNFSVNCSLQTLALNNNNLEGEIPLSLSNCKSLEVLNVGNNNLGGSFPCMQPSSNLHVLVLHSNRFQGEVRCHRNWTNLQIVDIASNNFSGYVYPESFLSWRGMMQDNHAQPMNNHLLFEMPAYGYHYQDSVTLTIKGRELVIVKITTYFTSIDFSCNNFHGEIPDVIGDLSSLYALNLSHNALTGNIPKPLGKLKQLGSLDLSVNQLTGEIPAELAELTFLSVLNLSYNKLVGEIPKGPQLQTFSSASFEGNAELCGFPVNVSCRNSDRNDDASPSSQMDRKKEVDGEYVSAALGFVVGLGSILWLLWGCQSMKEKLSDLVDGVVEKIFELKDRRTRLRRQVLPRDQVRRH